ncbi:class I SAM-dependent methyltransferase [Clostridiaceae bacterium M8S5]|nr:class I SAM-dependent methyltransferase [Clostridiaceae bacterium M8S5]
MKNNNINWQKESTRFDVASDYYDKYRPSYPSQMIEHLLKYTNMVPTKQILEIGSGSGKATELFVNRGYNLTCIEQGVNLVSKGNEKFAHTNQVSFINTRFEDWHVSKNTYDLVISAQAFHWVEKPLGFIKSAKALKPNGHVGLFWNMYYDDEDISTKPLIDICKKYGVVPFSTRSNLQKLQLINIKEINESNVFNKPDVFVYPWSIITDWQAFVGFLKTGNGYIALKPSVKTQLENELLSIFKALGGSFEFKFKCTLYIAQKKIAS